MKYRRKSAWTAALTLTLALLLVGCAATIGVPSVSSYEPESSVPSGDSTEAGAHESFTGNNVEKAFSDDARIVVEKQNGIYIVYVLDDLSVKITGEGQYDISYKVGTGVALMMGASDTYIPQDPYMPLLATDRNFENLIDIANIDPRNTVHYTSDEIKLESDDIKTEDEEFKNRLAGTYIESSIRMSSFSDTIETDTNVLYASTPVLILTDYLDERVIDKGSYEIDYDTLEETGVITIICEFDKPESGPPLNGIPQIVTLVIDGTEYISTSSRGDGSGDRYTKTYGIKMPVGDTLEDGYTLIGSGYQSLTLPHAFEIDLSTYAS